MLPISNLRMHEATGLIQGLRQNAIRAEVSTIKRGRYTVAVYANNVEPIIAAVLAETRARIRANAIVERT